MLSSFVSIAACGFAIWLLSIPLAHLLSPLRSIPGPFTARFSRLWFLIRTYRGHFEKDNVNLHHKYGPVVRYGPHHYSFNDPEAVKIIYGKGTELDKSDWYEAWNAPGFKTLFTEPSVKIHSQMRRKFQHTYSMSSLVTYEAYADHCIDAFKEKLDEIAEGSRNVDVAHWFLCYAADTVAMITYSKRMGFLDAGDDVGGFFKDLHGNLQYNTLMGIYAKLHPLVFRIWSWLSALKLVKGTPRMSLGYFSANRIAEKREQRKRDSKLQFVDESAPKDFLSKFLDAHERDPSRFTEHDINIGLVGNVIAGADTTAAALSATLYCLLNHPVCLKKLRDEIAARERDGRLSSPATFKETQDMPYLQAVIQEAQRLYPGTGLPLQREVPTGGAQICGYHFPAGTVVGVNAFVLHTNTSIFGADATVFRPERWLESDRDAVSYMQRHFMAFGLGSRTCIGKNISLLEMSKLVPELVRRFDFELGDELAGGGKEWEWINYWLMRPANLSVRVRLRQ